MLKLIHVNLTKDVTYEKDGIAIVVPADTVVQVDPSKEVGVWNGDHFDLFRDEYCLTN